METTIRTEMEYVEKVKLGGQRLSGRSKKTYKSCITKLGLDSEKKCTIAKTIDYRL